MIVKIANSAFTQTSLTVAEGEVPVILQCTGADLEETLKKAESNPWVVGVEFIGQRDDLPFAFVTPDPSVNLYTIIPIEGLTYNGIKEGIARKYPPAMGLVLRTEESFSDMRMVQELCREFPNVRFIGGNFIALKDCRFGEAERRGVHKKNPLLLSGMCTTEEIVSATSITYTLTDIQCLIKVKRKQEKAGQSKTEKAKKVKKSSKPNVTFASASGLSAF